MLRLSIGLGLLTCIAAAVPAAALTVDAVERAALSNNPGPSKTRIRPEVVRAEILLARAGFSSGVIDGIDGDNFRKALAAYQRQQSLPSTGALDQATFDKLTADAAPVLERYTITRADAKGPFTRQIPSGFEAQSRLKRLGFHDMKEALGERFHVSASLLADLNPGAALHRGREIQVPAASAPRPDKKATRVVVDKAGGAVEAFGQDGKLLAFYPASIGSTEKPAPTGQFEIRRIVHNPDYTYDPKYHFKGVRATQPFTIAPGPNNPVGSVWIDLSDDGYGIHGTPRPDLIGKTQSHGCIRLTNWDANALAGMIDKGTPVLFEDAAGTPAPPLAASPPPAADPSKRTGAEIAHP